MTRTPGRTVLRLALAGLTGLTAAAVGLFFAAAPAGAAASPSYVRLAHLSPDTPNIEST